MSIGKLNHYILYLSSSFKSFVAHTTLATVSLKHFLPMKYLLVSQSFYSPRSRDMLGIVFFGRSIIILTFIRNKRIDLNVWHIMVSVQNTHLTIITTVNLIYYWSSIIQLNYTGEIRIGAFELDEIIKWQFIGKLENRTSDYGRPWRFRLTGGVNSQIKLLDKKSYTYRIKIEHVAYEHRPTTLRTPPVRVTDRATGRRHVCNATEDETDVIVRRYSVLKTVALIDIDSSFTTLPAWDRTRSALHGGVTRAARTTPYGRSHQSAEAHRCCGSISAVDDPLVLENRSWRVCKKHCKSNRKRTGTALFEKRSSHGRRSFPFGPADGRQKAG